MKTQTLALAFFALAALPGAAAAEAPKTAYAFEIDLAGAETPEGAARVLADIRRQAARVCSPLNAADGMLTKASRECREDVAENAVRTIDRPLVSALWSRENEQRLARG